MNAEKDEGFLYGLDERPPLGRNLFYGFQCSILMISSLTLLTALAAAALGLGLLKGP